jgi:hypothetical protein
MRSKVWKVQKESGHEIAVFSTEKKAIKFVTVVHSAPYLKVSSINIKDIPDISIIDLYEKGSTFVYEVRLSGDPTIEENWSVHFIGYSMDLSDQKGIVFSYDRDYYVVITLAKTYSTALGLGKKYITEAIEGGSFDKDYTRPGYIKSYREDHLTEEMIEKTPIAKVNEKVYKVIDRIRENHDITPCELYSLLGPTEVNLDSLLLETVKYILGGPALLTSDDDLHWKRVLTEKDLKTQIPRRMISNLGVEDMLAY